MKFLCLKNYGKQVIHDTSYDSRDIGDIELEVNAFKVGEIYFSIDEYIQNGECGYQLESKFLRYKGNKHNFSMWIYPTMEYWKDYFKIIEG